MTPYLPGGPPCGTRTRVARLRTGRPTQLAERRVKWSGWQDSNLHDDLLPKQGTYQLVHTQMVPLLATLSLLAWEVDPMWRVLTVRRTVPDPARVNAGRKVAGTPGIEPGFSDRQSEVLAAERHARKCYQSQESNLDALAQAFLQPFTVLSGRRVGIEPTRSPRSRPSRTVLRAYLR